MFNIIIKAQQAETLTSTLTEGVVQVASEQFYSILSNFNFFALAFTIFYTTILYMNFYYWRLYRSADRLHNEAKGVKSIQDAWWMWVRYLYSLLFLTLAISSSNGVVRSIFILIYFYVLMFYTMPNNINSVLSTVSQAFGQIGWKGDWPKTFSTYITTFKYNTLLTNKKITVWYVIATIYMIVSIISTIGMTIWSLIL